MSGRSIRSCAKPFQHHINWFFQWRKVRCRLMQPLSSVIKILCFYDSICPPIFSALMHIYSKKQCNMSNFIFLPLCFNYSIGNTAFHNAHNWPQVDKNVIVFANSSTGSNCQQLTMPSFANCLWYHSWCTAFPISFYQFFCRQCWFYFTPPVSCNTVWKY